MAMTVQEVSKLMDTEGLRYFVDPARPVLFFGIGGTHGKYQILIILDSEGQFLQFRTIQYGECKKGNPHLPLLLRVLGEVNARNRFVKYGWDPNDGEVMAYGDVWLADAKLTQDQFHRMMGNFLPVIDADMRRIAHVVAHGTDPGPQDAAPARGGEAGPSPEPAPDGPVVL